MRSIFIPWMMGINHFIRPSTYHQSFISRPKGNTIWMIRKGSDISMVLFKRTHIDRICLCWRRLCEEGIDSFVLLDLP
jgi:hypothetical protein